MRVVIGKTALQARNLGYVSLAKQCCYLILVLK